MHGLLRALALGTVLILASGCSAAADLGRLADQLASAARTPSAPAAVVTDAESAIRGALERANAAQAEAFAAKTPLAMRETSTAAHYQDMVDTNRSLASAGISAIALVRIEFGDIRVDGAVAQATTFETWRTEYADGSVNEQTDRNDYTLVNEDGAWKISANVQPAARPIAPVADPAADPAPALQPATTASRSTNWSGYAASGGTFISVTGTWTVPNVSATTAGADATWVGIGGLDTEDLVQAGTMANVTGNGGVTYEAWIEMLPDSSRTVPLSVSAGDAVTVTLTERSADRWLIAMKNNTTGGTYSITVSYASTRTSAEWVQEAPSTGRGIVPLSSFGSVRFTGGTAVRDGTTLTIAALGARPISMYNRADQPLAIPSMLDAAGDGFSVTRTSAAGTTSSGSGRRRR